MSAARPTPLTPIRVMMLTWAIGAVLFLAHQAIGYGLFRKRALRWSRAPTDARIAAALRDTAAAMGLKTAIPVRISPEVSSPLMIGFAKPLLFLPTEPYSDTDLAFILRHELTHYRRRDLWYKLLLMLVNAVHWFNPAAYLLFREASADLELSCDDQVLRGLSGEDRRRYSETILASISAQTSPKTALSTYFYGGQYTMQRRFENIFHPQKKQRGAPVLLAVLLTLGLLGGLIACNVEEEAENTLLTRLGYTKALLTDLLDNRTTFDGDNGQIDHLVQSLPLPSFRSYSAFSLQTAPSNELQLVYQAADRVYPVGNGLDPFPGMIEENNALLLFAAIEGLEQIRFLHYDQQMPEWDNVYTLDALTARFGEVKPLEMDLAALYGALGSNIHPTEFYFGHYARIYLGIEPERVPYRNGEPHEVRPQPDGSTVWIYRSFGDIYNLSPEGPNAEAPESTALYYFDSAAAEQDDQLVGLYATRFVHGDHDGKTYEEITAIFGPPSTIKEMGGGDRYIAYALSEGQQRNAYFVLRDDRAVEEGVMYGADYTLLDFE
ncbi:MAG: DUF4825 domain-containing protein [Clostridiales bacterium]|nr:DUF4825 domain-containing protein [Clostridiales bacterium]